MCFSCEFQWLTSIMGFKYRITHDCGIRYCRCCKHKETVHFGFEYARYCYLWEKGNALMIVWIEIHLPYFEHNNINTPNTTSYNSPPISQQRGASGTRFMAITRRRLIQKKILSNITNVDKELFLKYVLLLFLYKRFLLKTTKQYILTYSKKNIEVKKIYWKNFIDPKKT